MRELNLEFIMATYQIVLMLFIVMILYLQMAKSRRRERKDLQKQAIHFINQWNSTDLVERTNLALSYENIEKLKSIELENPKHYDTRNFEHLIVLLNFFEEIGLYVDNQLVDEEILSKYFTQTSVEIYKVSEKYIELLRYQRRNPTLYRHFEKLVNKWMFSKI